MTELIGNFHFLRPAWLLLLPAVAVLVWLFRRSHDPARTYSGLVAPHLLSHLVVAPDAGRRLRPGGVLAVLAVVATIALAGPSWRHEPSPFGEDSAVLVVVMRVAPSMETNDLQPSRLERARNKLRDLVALRAGARTGLIAYAGSAHLVLPPTVDGRIVEQMAAALEPGVMPGDGDALMQALALAQSQIERAEGKGSVVVITDGVTPAQLEGLAAVERAFPVQFLAMAPDAEAAARGGLEAAAQAVGGGLQLLTPDDRDVRAVNARATSVAAFAASEGQRWRDEGYLLVPVIVLGVLLWGIRGWSVRWE